VATDRLDQYAASAVGASSPGDLVNHSRLPLNQAATFKAKLLMYERVDTEACILTYNCHFWTFRNSYRCSKIVSHV